MTLCINPHCQNPYNSDQNLFCQTCGSELLINGRYRILKLLSDKGGFANTYEAIDPHHQTKVIKILTNNHPKAIELFKKEADVLTQLDHPGIPKGEGALTYFPRDRKVPLHCLVMEKVEGMDLEEYQKQRDNQPIDQDLAIEWLWQLANILDEVHSHHFFHRDLKPSNIILRPDGQLALIDFGAVRQITATILGGGQNTGIYTPGYAPPEQEKGYAVQQSDFFALGRTFVYLLTGKAPTDPVIYDHYNNELHWEKLVPNLMPRLVYFINYLMEEKANQRPPDTATLLKEINQIKQEAHSHYNKDEENPYQKNQKIPATVVNQNQGALVVYGGFWKRWGAAIIDNVFITIASMLAGLGFGIYLLINYTINQSDDVFAIALFAGFGCNIIGFLVGIVMGIAIVFTPESYAEIDQFYLISLWIGIILKWLYFVMFESSKKQATFGKIMTGLMVTDLQGKRLSFKSANIRYLSKIISSILIYFGYFLAGWTKRKQALHDKIADTLVIRKSS
jgi:eukaryotic-like serine/threonine-protein kinase